MSQITLGLSEIRTGEASTTGTMPGSMTKIGMTYAGTCKINQDESEVTEHFEEGAASPAVRSKKKNVPKVTFSIMNPDPKLLADYIGGTVTGTGDEAVWGYDGTEVVENKAFSIIPKSGLQFDIPNGDVEAVINADMDSQGIFLVDFTITPMAVTEGKAIQGKKIS